ncbi:hypothetical protein MKEN_00193300 [Mycena kentingensis (nom. inval.)]|nr:hypothetical protein MKEN_00193300 [Mycena kentingensis (nom. inval.)]
MTATNDWMDFLSSLATSESYGSAINTSTLTSPLDSLDAEGGWSSLLATEGKNHNGPDATLDPSTSFNGGADALPTGLSAGDEKASRRQAHCSLSHPVQAYIALLDWISSTDAGSRFQFVAAGSTLPPRSFATEPGSICYITSGLQDILAHGAASNVDRSVASSPTASTVLDLTTDGESSTSSSPISPISIDLPMDGYGSTCTFSPPAHGPFPSAASTIITPAPEPYLGSRAPGALSAPRPKGPSLSGWVSSFSASTSSSRPLPAPAPMTFMRRNPKSARPVHKTAAAYESRVRAARAAEQKTKRRGPILCGWTEAVSQPQSQPQPQPQPQLQRFARPVLRGWTGPTSTSTPKPTSTGPASSHMPSGHGPAPPVFAAVPAPVYAAIPVPDPVYTVAPVPATSPSPAYAMDLDVYATPIDVDYESVPVPDKELDTELFGDAPEDGETLEDLLTAAMDEAFVYPAPASTLFWFPSLASIALDWTSRFGLLLLAALAFVAWTMDGRKCPACFGIILLLLVCFWVSCWRTFFFCGFLPDLTRLLKLYLLSGAGASYCGTFFSCGFLPDLTRLSKLLTICFRAPARYIALLELGYRAQMAPSSSRLRAHRRTPPVA